MICTNCTSEENHGGQFCRVCGGELRPAAARGETVLPNMPAEARAEIARAVAYQISRLNSAGELKTVAEDVLPELEKFLETPREKRLRRMRSGTIAAAAGLGAALFFILMGALRDRELLPLMAVGFTAFFIGLGIIINGKWLTVDRNTTESPALPEKMQDFLAAPQSFSTPALPPAPARVPYISVTENTTHRLKAKDEGERQRQRMKDSAKDEG